VHIFRVKDPGLDLILLLSQNLSRLYRAFAARVVPDVQKSHEAVGENRGAVDQDSRGAHDVIGRERDADVVRPEFSVELVPEVLVQVLRLLKTHAGAITMILAVDPSRMGRLGGDLLEMSPLRIELDPWGVEEVERYIRSSLSSAGGMPDIFDASAIGRLCELASGIPRWVRELAELALLAGASEQRGHIDAETIESAYQEISAAYAQRPSAAWAG